jgi:hypothetical protein
MIGMRIVLPKSDFADSKSVFDNVEIVARFFENGSRTGRGFAAATYQGKLVGVAAFEPATRPERDVTGGALTAIAADDSANGAVVCYPERYPRQITFLTASAIFAAKSLKMLMERVKGIEPSS